MPVDTAKIKVFIDFDGTIAVKDVGASVFIQYGEEKKVNEIISLYRSGDINARETWFELIKTLKTNDISEIMNFTGSFDLDPYFDDFARFLTQNEIEFFILSDGFSFYIEQLLKKYNLEGVNYFSNQLNFNGVNWEVSFSLTDEECQKCAHCKRNRVLDLSGDDEYTIYIGNGGSDFCPAEFCDTVFAKDQLARHCEKNGIDYHPFKNFFDVKRVVESLINRNRLRKKHRPAIKRKQVYQSG